MGKPRDTPDGKSGYPEKQPRDREDARKPGAKKKPPDPDDGGLDRDPERDGTHGGD